MLQMPPYFNAHKHLPFYHHPLVLENVVISPLLYKHHHQLE